MASSILYFATQMTLVVRSTLRPIYSQLHCRQ